LPGYHPGTRLWLHLAPGLTVPAVADHPHPEQVEEAKRLLLVELLGDFPFVDAAGKAHTLAALLLPFVRQMIDGPTPLHLFDAPVEGTGKTLLTNLIGVVSTGREPAAMAEARDDEEWRKRITAKLLEAPTFILLDNLNRSVDTGALAGVLTSRTWNDRVLGETKTVTLPNSAVWLGSGNNVKLSRELIRRTICTRLDSHSDCPWERTGFRHPDVFGWAKANRGKLIWAALTLCRAWIAAGRPVGKETLGMFEAWVKVIGGILDVAGAPGLLSNSKEFRNAAGDVMGEWREFVAAWWKTRGGERVGVQDLYMIATREQLLDSVLGDGKERSQRIRLGKGLGKMRDRIVGYHRVEACDTEHSGRQMYRLSEVAATASETTPNTPTPPDSTGGYEADDPGVRTDVFE
jgi:hypothetical protein